MNIFKKSLLLGIFLIDSILFNNKLKRLKIASIQQKNQICYLQSEFSELNKKLEKTNQSQAEKDNQYIDFLNKITNTILENKVIEITKSSKNDQGKCIAIAKWISENICNQTKKIGFQKLIYPLIILFQDLAFVEKEPCFFLKC